jgi:hypothetical protein
MHSLCWAPRCFVLSARGWGLHGRQTAVSSALCLQPLLPKRIDGDYGLIVFVLYIYRSIFEWRSASNAHHCLPTAIQLSPLMYMSKYLPI